MTVTHEILIGPYRSGKSWLLLERAIQHCLDKSADDKNTNLNSETIIIVPSQRYRKLLEKRLKQLLDKRPTEAEQTNFEPKNSSTNKTGLWGLKILTFYQFCQVNLLQAGIFPKLLPEAAKSPLLSVVCKQLIHAGKIKKLAPIIESAGAQSSILSLMDEWQRSGYTAAEILKKSASNTEIDKQDKDKAKDHKHELAEIYAAYERATEDLKCLDDHGLVFKLMEILNSSKQTNWLSNFIVVDGFDRLNTLQIDLLKALSKHTEKLYIAFDYEQPGDNLFEEYAWKTRSYEQIVAHLGKSFEFKKIDETADKTIDGVPSTHNATNTTNESLATTISALIDSFVTSDRLAEMSIIAARVKAAIIVDNLKPEEIVVTARNLAPYKSAIEAAFQDAGIEYHIDEPIALITLPLIKFLLSLLSLASENFIRRQAIDCLRSPYFRLSAFGLNTKDVELLNTLSLQAKVVAGQSQWQLAIRKAPQLLKACEKLFSQILALEKLSTANDAIAYATAVEELLDHVLDLSIVGDHLDPLLVWKQKEALAQFRRQLAILIQEEEIYKKLKHENKIASLFERLKQLVEKANFPGAAHDPNKVLVTSAELVPNQKYKFIYLAGMLEGEFPTVRTNNGFLTAQEIEQWRQIGVSIYNPRLESGFEYALFASLINRASEKLTLSYPLADISSSKNELVPSFFLSGLNIMPEEKQYAALSFADKDIAFNSPRNTLLYGFWQGYKATELTSTFTSPAIKGFIDQLQEKLSFAQIRSKQLLQSPVNGYLIDHVAASTVKIKLPDYWNAGQLNDYGKCPFNYWLNRMLKITPHEEPLAGLSIQDRGTFYHKALELFYKDIIDNKISMTAAQEVLKEHFDKAIQEALAWLEQQAWFRADEFWAQEKNELAFRLQNFFAAEHERFMTEGGQYVPYITEASFGPEDQYPPLSLEQNGKEIKIRGKIDRIDLETDSSTAIAEFASNTVLAHDSNRNSKRLRLIDYKSGSTYISRDDFESGRNLQLPLYALAVERSIMPGSTASNYQYLSIGTGKLLSGKRQDETDVQNDLNMLKEKVFEFVENIEKGNFSVQPSNDKVCLSCSHQTVCRIKEFPKRAGQALEE